MDVDRKPRNLFGKWLVLVFSILSYGLSIGIPSALSVMFLDWQDTFSASRAHTAIIHSTCFSILLGGAVFAGYTMNRIGARLTMLIGSVLATGGLFISAFATSINFLIVSVGIVSGLGFSFTQLPVIPCASSIVKKYVSLVISLCTITGALFGIVNRYLLRYLIDEYSWRGACIIFAGLTMQTSVGGMVITAMMQPSKSSLLTDVERDVEDHSEVSQNEYSVLVSGSTRSLNALLNVNEKKSEVNRISDRECSDVCTKTFDVPKIADSPSIVFENDVIFSSDVEDDGDSTKKNCCNLSKWIFFKDFMFLLLVLHIGTSVAFMYSLCLILMDFARTLNFDESTGVSFLTVTFASSLFGRVVVSIGDIFPKIQSFIIQSLISIPGCIAMLLLSFITERYIVICLLALVGISVGGQIAIYPKCAMDVRSVTRESFPIAFGFFCSVEGIMSLVAACAIGLSVDRTGSYMFILTVMGFTSLATTILLGGGYFYTSRQQKKQQRDKNKNSSDGGG